MNAGYFIVQHMGALLEEAVYRLIYQGLVAGDGRGGYDHRVSLNYMKLAMVAVGDAHQGRGRLSLAAGSQQYDLPFVIVKG